ncbi:putative membrane protein [Aliarcobacter faecis]|uniref:hypothetical protein n=1 Tax=Aliarcobacter faecis TaxID=1564138 RepID=UPI00047E7AE9|nr:hypothetical protein [Aliarcobacter faecis]QKF72548.1 putative membrane protein [Aliarcobacter faecis]
MYELLKTIHIITIVLFVGTVFFRTFVLFKLSKIYEKQESMKIQKFLGNEARKIIRINNSILIISGILLYTLFYMKSASLILIIKAILGLLLALAFFGIPKFLEKINTKPKFTILFHYFYFSLLLLVIIFSQYI